LLIRNRYDYLAETIHIVLISIHVPIRGRDLELGRDADTGGQTKSIVAPGRALADATGVERVDLLTRLVDDQAVSADSAQPTEARRGRATIVRIRYAPPGYLRKEDLWDPNASPPNAARAMAASRARRSAVANEAVMRDHLIFGGCQTQDAVSSSRHPRR
jgi:hypothetical protein